MLTATTLTHDSSLPTGSPIDSSAGSNPHGLDALIGRIENARPTTPDEARVCLESVALEPVDLLPWADFDHPAADSYGRKLVHRGSNWELMVMSWQPGDYSAIHDHGVAEWGAVRYFGAADHVVFRLENEVLQIGERMTTELGQVFPVSHTLIHLMGNPTSEPFMSLHFYGSDVPADSVTGSARVFDLAEGRIQRTDGGVFFCLPESEIDRRESGPSASSAAARLHHTLMQQRIRRMREAGDESPALAAREARIAHELDAHAPSVRRAGTP